MKKIILTFAVVGVAIVASSYAQATTSVTKLVVSANGANEKPNSGATTGSASGTFILNTAKNTICFTNMKTKGLTDLTGAHIHLGASGIDGSIFIFFDISNFNKVKQTCMKADHSVLLDISKHPGDYYFNVHTKKFPGGAVRGQLKKVA